MVVSLLGSYKHSPEARPVQGGGALDEIGAVRILATLFRRNGTKRAATAGGAKRTKRIGEGRAVYKGGGGEKQITSVFMFVFFIFMEHVLFFFF